MIAITLHKSSSISLSGRGVPTSPSWTREIICACPLFCHWGMLHVISWVLQLLFSIILTQLSLLDNFMPINPTSMFYSWKKVSKYFTAFSLRWQHIKQWQKNWHLYDEEFNKCKFFFVHPGYNNRNLLRWKKQFAGYFCAFQLYQYEVFPIIFYQLSATCHATCIRCQVISPL